MATSSSNSSTSNPRVIEDAERFIRNLCQRSFGHRSQNETQKVIDMEFLPYADQILALPPTTCFTEEPPLESVVRWALAEKCYPLLRYLVRNGWDVNLNYVGSLGCPSLLGQPHILKDLELTRFLLTHGADPRVGNTPHPAPIAPTRSSKGSLLHWDSIFSDLETFKLLLSHGSNLSYAHPLHGAAYAGPSQLPIIRYLVGSGLVDVDELDVFLIPHGGTPLLVAIRNCHVEVVRVLLEEFGAHPLARIESPYVTDAEKIAGGLAGENEEASREILKMLEVARGNREREGRLGGAPVTGADRRRR